MKKNNNGRVNFQRAVLKSIEFCSQPKFTITTKVDIWNDFIFGLVL